MAKPADLAARKELLLARSRLHRLELQHEARSLKRALFTPRSALALAKSAPARPLLLSALMFVIGRGRLARVVRGAMTALAVLKAVRAASALMPSPRAGAARRR